MATPRPHAQSPEAVRRELQRLRAELDRSIRDGSASVDDLLAQLEALEERVAALEASPGGVTTSDIWMPDAPPLSPHSADDEFDAGSLDAQWTEWDPGTYMTPSVDTSYECLNLDGTGNGGTRHAGIYQAVPASEFVAYTKVAVRGVAPGECRAGLFVSDDIVTNPTTADLRVCEVITPATVVGWVGSTRTLAAYNGAASAASNTSNILMSYLYLRMRCNGSTVASDISTDGMGWWQLASVVLGFTPTHVGLFLNAIANQAFTAHFPFFRVLSGAGTSSITGTRLGRVVGVVNP